MAAAFLMSSFLSLILRKVIPFEYCPRILPQNDIKIVDLQFVKSTFLKFGIPCAHTHTLHLTFKQLSHSPSFF